MCAVSSLVTYISTRNLAMYLVFVSQEIQCCTRATLVVIFSYDDELMMMMMIVMQNGQVNQDRHQIY